MNRCPFCNTLEPKEKNKQKHFWRRHNAEICQRAKVFMPTGIKSVEDEEQNEKTMQVTVAGKLIL